MFVLWKDHTGQAECEEINALCARSEVNYACHSGNHYSAECFWSKVLHLLRGDEELRRDAWSVVELCDWIPAVLTGCPDAASVKMGHCVSGSKLMWAEEWGGYPPESFFAELDPVLLPIVRNLPNVNYGCDVAAGRLTEAWAGRTGTSGRHSRRRGLHRLAFGRRGCRRALRNGGAQSGYVGLLYGRHAARGAGR